MKPDQIITTARALRSCVAQFSNAESHKQKFEAQIAALMEDVTADFDVRTGADLAALRGAIELADVGIPRLRKNLSAAIAQGMNTQDSACAAITDLHQKIDEAISRKILAAASDDIRGSINPRLTRPFLAEAECRPDTTVLHIFFGSGTNDAALRDAAVSIAGRLETMAKETERAATVAKKLGLAA